MCDTCAPGWDDAAGCLRYLGATETRTIPQQELKEFWGFTKLRIAWGGRGRYFYRRFMIIWTEKFATGSVNLDQQHRVLIDTINELGGHLTNPNFNPQEFELLINQVDYIADYADVHFKGEEECMERFRCPAHAQNQQAHAKFRKAIQEYKTGFEKHGFNMELLQTLHEYMEKWIQDHILKIDTQLQPCIEASKLRESPGAKRPK